MIIEAPTFKGSAKKLKGAAAPCHGTKAQRRRKGAIKPPKGVGKEEKFR